MGLFSHNKELTSRVIVVFDIGSSSVGGAIVRYAEGVRPEILKSTRSYIMLREELNFEHFVSMIMRAIDKVGEELLSAKVAAPEEIVITLRAPWVASQTRILHVHKPQPFVITPEITNELIQKEILRFHEGNIKDFADLVNDHLLLEHKTMRSRLNGYTVTHPIGKRATELELASFMSVISKTIYHKIEQRIGRIFHTKTTMHSFLFAAYAMVKQIFNNQDDAILIDVGGEITDIGIVRDDVLLQTISFPYGKNNIFRLIAKSLDISLEEASSSFRMYSNSSLSEQKMYEIKPVIEQAQKEWLERFRTVLTDISQTALIPDMVFLYTDEDVNMIFQEMVEHEDLHQYISSHSRFTVVPMNIDTLRGHVIDHETKHDSFLITSSLFAGLLVSRNEEEDFPIF